MNSERIDHTPMVAKLTVLIVVALITTFIVWASWAEVDELARGEGKVIPLSKTQIVQASEAGVVEEIAVSLGQKVSKGDLLVRLDDTTTSSSLGESKARAQALNAQVARLELEIADLLYGVYACPEAVQRDAPRKCANEQQLFETRRDGFMKKHLVLQTRETQRHQELDEARVNIERLTNLLTVMEAEREKIAPLVRRQLHPEVNLLRLDREITEHRGQKAMAIQSIARLESAIDEARFQLEELQLQYRQDARQELSNVLTELGVLTSTIRGASDRVARTDIRSPVDGIVNTLEVNTLGAFVQPGAVVAGVVPTTDSLLVEAKISPKDVAFIQPGQKALVKVTAYDFSIFGGLDGTVATVSADSIVEPETGETYYDVRIKTEVSHLGKSEVSHEIRPGMVATVEVLTGSKSVLDYLLKPLVKARYVALTER